MNFGIPIPQVFLDGRVDTSVIRDSLQLAEERGLQSAWTQERAFAKWLEWLKLGLVLLLPSYLPLSPPAVLALQVYLLISVLFLSWLTLNPARISADARRG